MSELYGPGADIEELIENGTIKSPSADHRILDLGCNDPGSFFRLYHKYNFLEYFGIDISESINVSIPYTASTRRPEELCLPSNSSIYEKYDAFHKHVLGSFHKLNKLAFEEIFHFQLSTDISDSLKAFKKSNGKFDLIVLSNILHLYPNKNDASNLIKDCINVLELDGQIFIKVFCTEYSAQTFHYSEDDLNELRSKLNIVHEEKSGNKISLVGRKK